MELKSLEEMAAYLENKFSSEMYTAKAQHITSRRKDVDYEIFLLTWTDSTGARRPEFDGPMRCKANGYTASHH